MATGSPHYRDTTKVVDIISPMMNGITLTQESADMQLVWLESGAGKIPTFADDYAATFVRNDVGTYIDKDDGVFKEAAANIIREEDNGYLIESTRQNIALYSQQLDAVAWSSSTISVVPNEAVAPDGTMTMDTLTAGPPNAIITQTITSAQADRIFSFYLLRKTGSGIIQLTVDGVTHWETVPVSSTVPTRVTITGANVTNPEIGIRIVTSGDAIWAWQADLEIGENVTSSIVTTNNIKTRAADILELPIADGINFNQSEGTLFCEVIPGFNAAEVPTAEIISLPTAYSGTIVGIWDSTDVYSRAGTYNATAPHNFIKDVPRKIFVRWNASLNEFAIGVDGTQGTPAVYGGTFHLGGNYLIGSDLDGYMLIKNIRVYNIDKGKAFCEAETT